MKYSNYFGAIAAAILIAVCFLPWVYIPSIEATLTGIDAVKTNFGKPGLLNIIFSVISIVLFMIPAIWAKRANLFIGAFNMAWAVRNYLLLTQCQMGECPEKKFGIFGLLVLSVVVLVMALIPANIHIKKEL